MTPAAPDICPHCDQPQDPARTDEHITTAHADIPPCTATLDNANTDGPLTCILRAGHPSRYRGPGNWHISALGPAGRTVWSDAADGATPHLAGTPETAP